MLYKDILQFERTWKQYCRQCKLIDNTLNILIPEGGVWTHFFFFFFFFNIECCNLKTILVMYIKVYISGMEMSQKIHFCYQILLKMLFFFFFCFFFWRKWQQKTLFRPNFLWQAKNNNFEIEMLKLSESHVKAQL